MSAEREQHIPTNRDGATAQPPRSQRRWVGALLGLSILGAAVASFVYLAITRPEPPKAARDDSADRVRVIDALRERIPRQWIGYGTSRAISSAEIPSRINSTVVEIPSTVVSGATVTRGDLVVRLDDSDFAAAVEMAEGSLKTIAAEQAALEVERTALRERRVLVEHELALARTDEERATKAAEDMSATAREVDRVRTARLVAEHALLIINEALAQCAPRADLLASRYTAQSAALRRAQDDVARCRITSPIDGTLAPFDLEVGESVATGSRVARVVDGSRVEVAIALSASARDSIVLGDLVMLKSLDETLATTVVARISPEDDPADRTMTLWVEVDRADGRTGGLAPGAFVEAIVTSSHPEVRSVVPRRSVRNERVLILEQGQLRPHTVRVVHGYEGRLEKSGIDDSEWLVLEAFLPEGAVIALDATRTLRPGRSVVGESAATAGSAPAPRRPSSP
ncbi:MAG: HlyD family efflux transporter periplasmic adaptor subunit [Phycisphaerales bacterium]|nr:HlyD family efflux transporter periplasmic adaptor subunit [Phycisphaerales bacterium]